jgi:hypothetical protein
MKRLYTAVLSGSLVLFCLPAWAGHHHGRYDTAKVIRTSPIFLTVRVPVNEQVCLRGQGWRHSHHSARPMARGRCEIRRSWRTEQRLVAWDVTYRYRGGVFHTQLQDRPGKRIRIPADNHWLAYSPRR